MTKANNFFAIGTAAQKLGCSRSMVRKIMKQHQYQVKTVDGWRLFTDEDVENLRSLWKKGFVK